MEFLSCEFSFSHSFVCFSVYLVQKEWESDSWQNQVELGRVITMQKTKQNKIKNEWMGRYLFVDVCQLWYIHILRNCYETME